MAPTTNPVPGSWTAEQGTWISPEEDSYNRCWNRQGVAIVRANPNQPSLLSALVGQAVRVRLNTPDTFFTLPALFRRGALRVYGYVSLTENVFTFTPLRKGGSK